VDELRQFEIEEARNLQRAMLPSGPIRKHAIEISHKFRPVANVGGDFLDYFWLDDNRLGFYLGDVVGKGLPAALFAALAMGMLRGIKKTGESPPAVLEMLNRRLTMRKPPERYCALQYAVFDPPTNRLCYANAGLPLPMHISPAGCLEIGEGGLPSGLFPEVRYEQHNLVLGAGDAVLFTTDGLLEARNPAGEEFGNERLVKLCGELWKETADGLLAGVFQAVDEFAAGTPQYDDMAAAALKLA
jgi:sigma-B regulation protein RsbU (phosphoserine phosphatase)